MKTKPKHIYINCSGIYLCSFKTGIYRIANNIINETNILSRYTGVKCFTVIAVRDCYIT